MAADYQNVSRAAASSYEEEPDYLTDFPRQRLTVTPSYQLPLVQAALARTASLNLSLQELRLRQEPRSGNRQDRRRAALHEIQYRPGSPCRGPFSSRIFESGKTRLKHLIEPEFDLRYATKVDNRDRLVPVDRFDYPSYSYAGFR